MNEPADFVASETAGDPRHAPTASATPASRDNDHKCERCQADLSRLRVTARFCPHCGGALPAGLAPTPLPVMAIDSAGSPVTSPRDLGAVATAWRELRRTPPFLPHVRGLPADDSVDDSHSLMLLGYANAMYRLGWRYETGLGTGRNTEEAIRCYFKAAKLGNSAALARLAPQCLAGDTPAHPCDPET